MSNLASALGLGLGLEEVGIEQLRQLRQCQRREQVSCCRGESMSSSCRSLEAERGGGAVGEMVHVDRDFLDPVTQGPHEVMCRPQVGATRAGYNSARVLGLVTPT